MVAIAGFSSTALRPLLLRVLFPQVPAQGAYPRAGGAGPECQPLGLILASISSPPCRSRSRCRTRSRSCQMRRRRHRSEYWLAIRQLRYPEEEGVAHIEAHRECAFGKRSGAARMDLIEY